MLQTYISRNVDGTQATVAQFTSNALHVATASRQVKAEDQRAMLL
jgi:hypothetical protein